MTAHRTRSAPRRVAGLAALLLVLGACSSASSEAGGDADADAGPASTSTTTEVSTPAADETIERTVVPLPDSVASARNPSFTADGKAIVFSATEPGGSTVELFRMAADGTDPTCLTCDLPARGDQPLLKPFTFRDGKRILVRVGEQSPVVNGTHAVLECSPSVSDCETAQLVPIEVPATADAALVQPQREFRIAPDGETVGFTQVRTDADGGERFVSIVGMLRKDGDRYVVDDPRAISDLGELKNFTPDGKAALVSAFTTLPDRAADPDVVAIDLASGDATDVTDNGDYDEDLAFAPDMRSYAVFSGRGQGLFETVAQVRRPNDIGPGLECLFGYLFANRRKELLEPWLVPTGAEQEGEMGQLLNPGSLDAGWDGRTVASWSTDGTRVLFWEDRGDPYGTPDPDGTRFVIAELPDRKPTTQSAPAASPAPTWAPELGGYVPDGLPIASSRTGAHAGSVTVVQEDGTEPGSGTIEVTYDGGLTGACDYQADLTVSGDHEGTLTADATIGPAGIDGTLTSTVDGHELSLP